MRRFSRCAAAVPLALCLAAFPVIRLGAQAPDPTLAAVMRADGLALPFARFDGRSWTPFPAPRGDTAAQPPERHEVPRVWRFYPVDGSPPRRLRGGTTVLFNTEGETWYETWAQVTDYAPRHMGDVAMFPDGRVGFALSGDAARPGVRAVAFAPHAAGSTLWHRVRPSVALAFGRSEARALARHPTARPGPWPRGRELPDSAERAGRPIVLDHLYASRDTITGVRLLYVEARKVYPGGNEPQCPAAVHYAAWFRQAPAAALVPVVEEAVPGVACDVPGQSSTVPFGAFMLGARTFVVAERNHWESSQRQVLEVMPAAVRPAP